MVRFFRVSPPSVHGMIVRLEEPGLAAPANRACRDLCEWPFLRRRFRIYWGPDKPAPPKESRTYPCRPASLVSGVRLAEGNASDQLAAGRSVGCQLPGGENFSANARSVGSFAVLSNTANTASPSETVVPSGSVYQPRSRISMVCWAICARVLRLAIV